MVDRIRWDTVSYLPFYYIFFEIDFQFLLLTIINLQVKILAIKDILSNLAPGDIKSAPAFEICVLGKLASPVCKLWSIIPRCSVMYKTRLII